MSTATDDIRVAVMGFVSEEGTFAKGARVRASHPAVVKNPHLFVGDGIPESEWGVTPFDQALESLARLEREEQERKAELFAMEASVNPVTLTVTPVMRCVKDFAAYVNGIPALVKKGSLALEDSAVVVDAPGNWKKA